MTRQLGPDSIIIRPAVRRCRLRPSMRGQTALSIAGGRMDPSISLQARKPPSFRSMRMRVINQRSPRNLRPSSMKQLLTQWWTTGSPLTTVRRWWGPGLLVTSVTMRRCNCQSPSTTMPLILSRSITIIRWSVSLMPVLDGVSIPPRPRSLLSVG